MPTGAQKGFNPARKLGSGPDNKAVSSYQIASGYATSIGKGDPVKLVAGKIQLATNGANVQGIFLGVDYQPSDITARPVFDHKWMAGTTTLNSSNATARVLDEPFATFAVIANGTTSQVLPGNIYAMDLTQGVDPYTGNSKAVALVLAQQNGTVTGLTASTTMVGNLGSTAGDTFTVATSNPANVTTTITIASGSTVTTVLAAINASANVRATLVGGSVVVQAIDGYSLITANGTGTPYTRLVGTPGTVTAGVAANAGMVKVFRVQDALNQVLEVYLVNDALKDNG